jgi:hypothetical protein
MSDSHEYRGVRELALRDDADSERSGELGSI